MSYQHDRDEFIARATREGLPLDAIYTLLRCATTIHRLAELACSSEAADRDRIPCPADPPSKGPCLCGIVGRNAVSSLLPAALGEHDTIPRITLQDYHAEQRAIEAVAVANKDLARRPSGAVAEGRGEWRVLIEGDPRGYTLKVIPPSYAERNQQACTACKGNGSLLVTGAGYESCSACKGTGRVEKDRSNLEAIGVPARDSRLRF